jgi:hypothetical protein
MHITTLVPPVDTKSIATKVTVHAEHPTTSSEVELSSLQETCSKSFSLLETDCYYRPSARTSVSTNKNKQA